MKLVLAASVVLPALVFGQAAPASAEMKLTCPSKWRAAKISETAYTCSTGKQVSNESEIQRNLAQARVLADKYCDNHVMSVKDVIVSGGRKQQIVIACGYLI